MQMTIMDLIKELSREAKEVKETKMTRPPHKQIDVDVTNEGRYQTVSGDKVVLFSKRKGLIYGLILDALGEFPTTWKDNGCHLVNPDFSLVEKEYPKKDTLVKVWDNGETEEDSLYRYVSHFSSEGRLYTFNDGATSRTTDNGDVTSWDNWEVVE